MGDWAKKKEAGGFDVRVIGYAFALNNGDGKFGPYSRLDVTLITQADGATETRTRFLDGGFLHKSHVGVVTVSKDGLTLEGGDPAEGVIPEGSEVDLFLNSMVEKGFDAASIGVGRNLAAIVGRRFGLTTVLDEAKTAREVKAGRPAKQQGKDGNEYDYTQLRVAAVHPADDYKPAKGTAAAKSQAAAKAAAPKAAADYTQADAALAGILAEAAGGELQKGLISSEVVKYALAKKLTGADRVALQKVVASDEYLKDAESRGLIIINAADPKKVVIVNAAVPA